MSKEKRTPPEILQVPIPAEVGEVGEGLLVVNTSTGMQVLPVGSVDSHGAHALANHAALFTRVVLESQIRTQIHGPNLAEVQEVVSDINETLGKGKGE